MKRSFKTRAREIFTPIFLAFLVLTGASFYANFQALQASSKIAREGKERRSQICQGFELAYEQEVESVQNTYAFLLEESPEERNSTLSKTLIRNLPAQEEEIMSDHDEVGVYVPLFCDEKGNGSPEPDPIVPERPTELDKLGRK